MLVGWREKRGISVAPVSASGAQVYRGSSSLPTGCRGDWGEGAHSSIRKHWNHTCALSPSLSQAQVLYILYPWFPLTDYPKTRSTYLAWFQNTLQFFSPKLPVSPLFNDNSYKRQTTDITFVLFLVAGYVSFSWLKISGCLHSFKMTWRKVKLWKTCHKQKRLTKVNSISWSMYMIHVSKSVTWISWSMYMYPTTACLGSSESYHMVTVPAAIYCASYVPFLMNIHPTFTQWATKVSALGAFSCLFVPPLHDDKIHKLSLTLLDHRTHCSQY